jgi:eukaryotic-like serine/threonine-protein kinase
MTQGPTDERAADRGGLATLAAGAAPPPVGGAASEPNSSVALDATMTADLDATLAPDVGGTAPGASTPRKTLDRVGLNQTIGAPLPETLGKAPSPTTMSTSVLPRIEQAGSAVRVVPSPGGERYKAIKRLGAGGMGEVALVEDSDIGRTVAVKRLLSPEQSPAMLARFIDEVHTVGGLEHPNIVPIHDVGIDQDGRYFFVMKYVDGETLEEIIERLRAGNAKAHATYSQRRRVEIFISLLRALEYAHDRNVIHRDLKPANIMVGRFGEVVLMDWGIARQVGSPSALDSDASAKRAAPSEFPVRVGDGELRISKRASATHAGELIGTPMYMSPEQAAGLNDTADARSDLYSACVLFHEFLGLRHRFESVDRLEALLTRVITSDPPPSPKMFDPHPAQRENIPYEMTHFLRRGLQLDPDARWQSASEMIEELQAILDGRCRVACATTLLKRTTSGVSRFVDRSPGKAMLIMYGGTFAVVLWLVVALVGWLIA